MSKNLPAVDTLCIKLEVSLVIKEAPPLSGLAVSFLEGKGAKQSSRNYSTVPTPPPQKNKVLLGFSRDLKLSTPWHSRVAYDM